MINFLNATGEHWWSWQVAMLWQTAVLIGILWIVDVCVRKWAHPQVRYALWMLVLVKLLISPTWTSPASVTSYIPGLAFRAAQSGRSILASEQSENKAVVPISLGERVETQSPVSPTIFGSIHEKVASHDSQRGLEARVPLPAADAEPVDAHMAATMVEPDMVPPAPSRQVNDTAKSSLRWKAYAMFTWLAGMIVLSTWLILRLSSLRKQHLECHPGLDPGSRAKPTGCRIPGSASGTSSVRHDNSRDLPECFYQQLEAVAAKLSLKRLPRVVLTDKVACPAVFGVFRPVLLMPAKKFKHMSQQDTEHILLHELAHIKRGDLLVHAVYMLVQIVYWFNPLLWMARRPMQNLRELCCDATVARLLRDKTYRYRETLLETARQLLAEPVDPGLGLLGLFENNNWLVTRLRWLEKNTWKNRPLRIATIIVLVAIMTTCVLPMANRPAAQESRRVKALAKIIQEDRGEERAKAADDLIKEIENKKTINISAQKALEAIINRIIKHPKTTDRDRKFDSYPKIYWGEIGLGFKLIANEKVNKDQSEDFLQALELIGCTYGVEHDGVFRLFGQLTAPRNMVANYKLKTLTIDGKEYKRDLLDVFPKTAGGGANWGRETTIKLDPEQSLELQLDVAWYQIPDSMVENLPDDWRDKDEILRDVIGDVSVKKLCEYTQRLKLTDDSNWQGIFGDNFSNNETQNYTATLPNGDTVELLGVCEVPDNGGYKRDYNNWWMPDGRPFANPPFKRLACSVQNQKDKKWVCFAYSIPVENKYQSPRQIGIENNSGSASGTILNEHDKHLHQPALGHQLFLLSTDQDTVELTFAFQGGPWRTLCEVTNNQHAFSFGDFNAYITPAKIENAQYVVRIREDWPWTFDQNYFMRYVIKLKDQPKPVDMTKYAEETTNHPGESPPVERLYVLDSNLQGKVEYIAAQYCVKQTAVFKNISLSAKRKTDVQAVVRKSPEPPFIYADMANPPAPVLQDFASGTVKDVPQFVFHAVHPQTVWQVLKSDKKHKPKWYFRINGKDYPWRMTGHLALTRYELIEADCFPTILEDKEKRWESGDYTLVYVVKNTVWQNPAGERCVCKELLSNTVEFKILEDGSFADINGIRFPTEKELKESKTTQNSELKGLEKTVSEKTIIDAIKKSLPDNYFIKEIQQNSWPIHFGKGNGVALYIADKNIQYRKQQYSSIVWLMPKDYTEKSAIKSQAYGAAEPPAVFMAETNNYNLYNWPGPTELAKKIVEMVKKTESKQNAANSELTATNYKATLSNGVTIELLGVCEHPSEGKQWWSPSGKPIPEISNAGDKFIGASYDEKYEHAFLIVYQFKSPISYGSLSSRLKINVDDVAYQPRSMNIIKTNVAEGIYTYGLVFAVMKKDFKSTSTADISFGVTFDENNKQWATLKKIALRPGGKTDVQIQSSVLSLQSSGKLTEQTKREIEAVVQRFWKAAQYTNDRQALLETIYFETAVDRDKFAQATKDMKTHSPLDYEPISITSVRKIAANDYEVAVSMPTDGNFVQTPLLVKSTPEGFKLDYLNKQWQMKAGKLLEAAEKTNNYTATLPNGVTIELVGLCSKPGSARWWSPAGIEISEPQYRAETHVGTLSEEFGCSILARITGEKDAFVVFRLPSGYLGGSGQFRGRGFVLGGLTKFPLEPIQKSEKADIGIGVAQGSWVDTGIEIENKPDAGPVTIKLQDKDTVVVDPLTDDQGVNGHKDTTVLYGMPSSIDYEFKAEFTTKDGSVLPNWGSTPVHARRDRPEKFLLSMDNIGPKEIVSFRIFYRKIEWAKFKNVALRPGGEGEERFSANNRSIWEELRRADELRVKIECGDTTVQEVVELFEAVIQKYPDSKYELESRFGIAQADKAQTQKQCRLIIDKWPDVVTHSTIYARNRVQKPEEWYRWLKSITDEQIIGGVRNYFVWPFEPTEEDIQRSLKSMQKAIGLHIQTYENDPSRQPSEKTEWTVKNDSGEGGTTNRPQIAIEAKVFTARVTHVMVAEQLKAAGVAVKLDPMGMLSFTDLTDAQSRQLEKWMVSTAGTSALTSPKVRVFDGETSQMALTDTQTFTTSYEGDTPKIDEFKTGVTFEFTPTYQKQDDAILLKLAFDKKMILNIMKQTDDSGRETEMPGFGTKSVHTTIAIPQGKTMLIPIAGVGGMGGMAGMASPPQTEQIYLLIKTELETQSSVSSPQDSGKEAEEKPVDTEDFERLEVSVAGMWIRGVGQITIHGDGKVESSMVLGPHNQTSVKSSYNLQPGQINKLNRLLENTDWLKQADAKNRPPLSDLTYYDMTFFRNKQTYKARLHDRSPEPYGSLVNMVRGIYRQEFLFSSLKSEDEKLRMNASREIFYELIIRMGLKGRSPSPMLTEVDFTRYEEIFAQWMSDPATYRQEELAAAIAWVGYLKRLDYYDYVIELKDVYARSDWDVVCETLLRLGGPKAVSALKDIVRVRSGRLDHAVSALIRLGQLGIPEILLILEEGALPPKRPSGWNEQLKQIHEQWTLAERVVRACMDSWNVPEFSAESKKEIADRVEKLLNSRIPGQWDAMRTEYFEQYLAMANSLPEMRKTDTEQNLSLRPGGETENRN